MDDHQMQNLMQNCVEEITALRGQVRLLTPKADAFDALTQVLGMMPQPSQGYAPDLVWRLRTEIKGLNPTNEVDGETPDNPARISEGE